MLITSAPLSTAQRTASAIWWSESSSPVAEPDRDRQQRRLGRRPDHAGLAPGAAPAASEATIVPCSAPSEPTGVWPFGAPRPEKSVPPTTAPARSATPDVDPGVDDGDRDARALGGRPGLPDAVVVEPVLASTHQVGGRRAMRRRRHGEQRRSERRSRRDDRQPSTAPRLRRRTAHRSGRPGRALECEVADRVHPGPAASACAARACRHLTRSGMPPAEIPGDLGDRLDALAVGEVLLVRGAVRGRRARRRRSSAASSAMTPVASSVEMAAVAAGWDR